MDTRNHVLPRPDVRRVFGEGREFVDVRVTATTASTAPAVEIGVRSGAIYAAATIQGETELRELRRAIDAALVEAGVRP